jgi:hypothetical protein
MKSGIKFGLLAFVVLAVTAGCGEEVVFLSHGSGFGVEGLDIQGSGFRDNSLRANNRIAQSSYP